LAPGRASHAVSAEAPPTVPPRSHPARHSRVIALMFADVAGGCAATWPPVLFVPRGRSSG